MTKIKNKMIDKKIYFVSGIDTDAGKSFATGYLARQLSEQKLRVITQKFIQTGCQNQQTGLRASISEDIEVHRKIMGTELQDCDLDGTSCPVMLDYPASADLAASLEGTTIDLNKIRQSTALLSARYDIVLVEGAGGLHVPINGLYTTIDYIQQEGLPLILVTNPKLGSVNHTFLSLEICRNRGIEVYAVLYNPCPESSEIISRDTEKTIKLYLDKYHPNCQFINIPFIKL